MVIAILKAVAEKLIPGIPIKTRISILQQTSSTEQSHDGGSVSSDVPRKLSVLETVVDRATSRNEIQNEIDGLHTPSISIAPCD